MGIHSTYTQEIADKICERLEEGEPLTEICRDMSLRVRTVYGWRDAHEDFAACFARAREIGFDAIAEKARKIAETPQEGVETEETDDGKVKTKRADMLGHRKLQIETYLKLLAKWDPKRFGDKLETTHTGPQHIVIDGVLAKV